MAKCSCFELSLEEQYSTLICVGDASSETAKHETLVTPSLLCDAKLTYSGTLGQLQGQMHVYPQEFSSIVTS